jgi:hypothetical protein
MVYVRNLLLALASCLVVAGCATPLAMDFDYDTTADFAALKTYDWTPPTGNATGDELLVKRVKSAVDSQLQGKGHALAQKDPDFLVAMQLSGRSAYGGSVGVGMSVGIPVGHAGRISVGGGRSKPIEKKEGMLVLDFLDAKTKALVWRGTASGAVDPAATPDQQQKRINDVVAQLLARFPPSK